MEITSEMNPSSDGLPHIFIKKHKPDEAVEGKRANSQETSGEDWHLAQIQISPRQVDCVGTRRKLRIRKRMKLLIPFILLLMAMVISFGVYREMQSSTLQARYLAKYASQLNYYVANGPSDTIVFPTKGPYNQRLGYIQLPELLEKLEKKGLVVTRQARFSIPLQRYTEKGLNIPYDSKCQTGLQLFDADQRVIYRKENPERIYRNYYSLPYVIIQTLLFIENRGLLSNDHPKVNPAVDWKRFLKAIGVQAATFLHFEVPSMGGSTLATQTEKFRHSAHGRTPSVKDKLLQMVSASVRAYRHGEDTTLFRKRLVLDYVNSVPLSAAPGFGEVNGLGDGLYVWYGTSFDEMNRLLNLREPMGEELVQQAKVIKQVISLMIAHRRPSYYLVHGRERLSELCNSYARLLANHGILSKVQLEYILAQPLEFRDFSREAVISERSHDKAVNVVRNRLGPLFETSLYTLDRMDLAVATTLKSKVQMEVSRYFNNLAQPEFAEKTGLLGKYLLKEGQVEDLSYSFTLYERTDRGNMVRVQTDTTQLLLDINEGSKLELGSTAKLRTLITYLEIVAELYTGLSPLTTKERAQFIQAGSDRLSLWVAEKLQQNSQLSLKGLLEDAMQRNYSANPNQRFYTGGGIHIFENFSKNDDRKVVSVTESLQNSINLPFVRIMNDIVQYSMEQVWPNSRKMQVNDKDPRRKMVLDQFIERESRDYLLRFWKKYHSMSDGQRWQSIVKKKRPRLVRLSILHRLFFPEKDLATFLAFLREQLPQSKMSDKKLTKFYEKYGPGKYNYQDMGYLTGDHPLELWLLQYLRKKDNVSFKDAFVRSRGVREDVYGWLMRTRAKKSRNNRVKVEMERDAFAEIHRRWKKLGYPFDYLVPSLGSALGSSGDRPAALAELMGIITNDGKRLPTHRFTRVEFGKGTPYETIMEPHETGFEQVLHPEIAGIVKNTLAKVVSNGTGKRLYRSLQYKNGEYAEIGGKTGTGDNRIVFTTSSGVRKSSRALNRTATFVFFLGDNHFGTLTAFVRGSSAGKFTFTSALPLQVLKGMLPILQPELQKYAPAKSRDSG